MDEQGMNHLSAEVNICSEVIQEANNAEKINSENHTEHEEPIENISGTYDGSENNVIIIEAQENNEEIYIYDTNENDGVHTENSSEFIQVCDSDNAFEAIEKTSGTEINIDVTEEEGKDKENDNSKDEEIEIVNCNEKNGEIEENKEFNENNAPIVSNKKITENLEGSQLKNYKNVILEDWEVEVPHLIESQESESYIEVDMVPQEPQITQTSDVQETVNCKNENYTVMEVTSGEQKDVVGNDKAKEQNSLADSQKENSNATLESEIMMLMSEKKVDSLKYPKSISKNEIVKILDESAERVVRPIVTGKDLFFSIELTKRLNQKISVNKSLKSSEVVEKDNSANESMACNNNNMVDDRQKIVDILEADEIKDWKSAPTKSDLVSKENGNDMEISNAIKNMEEGDASGKTKTPKKTPLKKFRKMDKELERSIALRQLRDEFPSTRKRSRATKKVNHIPFLASTVLEKALTSPEVTTALKPGPPRRRPCYLPDNASHTKSSSNVEVETNAVDKLHTVDSQVRKTEEDTAGSTNFNTEGNSKSGTDFTDLVLEGSPKSSTSNTVVKTYSAKRKSTDAENDIKSTLETIAAVTRALSESAEETIESKPKKLKTVTKPDNKNNNNNKALVKKKAKLKVGTGIEKKRNLELEKLLGDEGAVRMLYDTQHGEGASTTPKKSKLKTTTGLKKDLVLKTKIVKNAVMRLSGVGTEGVFLRGKRRSNKSKSEVSNQDPEPLFSSTPNIVLYKPKKKQRAEASRILYRHSSSESFDSSEGYRRTSFDESLNISTKEGPVFTGDKSEDLNSTCTTTETQKVSLKGKPKKAEIFIKKRLKRLQNAKRLSQKREIKVPKAKGRMERTSTDSMSTSCSKLNLSIVPVRKSSRPRMVSKKYSIWSSTSMDSLSVESLGFKKLKKASLELGKKLNCKRLMILQHESLVQVVLSSPSSLLKNSLNDEILQELTQVFNFLSEEDRCKVVLLTSSGSTFCQGVDINQIISFNESEKKNGISQLAKGIREFMTCLTDFEKPIIAGVQGAAVGLGVTILPYCDLVICSDKASFSTPYVKLGQAPEGAPTHTFPRISRHLVSELLFKSHKMTATDALKHGLVTQVIPEERFDEELIIISRNMAAQPIQGTQSIKFLLRRSDREAIMETLRLEEEMLEEHWNSPECRSNIVRFLNSGELQLKQLDNS